MFDAIEERQRYRAETTARQIYELVGNEERFLSRIDENPELEVLLAQAIEAATRTGFEAKRLLLARTAAAAFENDEQVDPATLVVSALSRLEPLHIRALARVARVADRSDLDNEARRAAMAEASGRVPIRATLIQTGVAIPATMIFGGAEIYDFSEFGRHLLEQLGALADEDSERLAP